jgi:hypothetical protein
MINQNEGWILLDNSKKFHYMMDGRSLCFKWMYLGHNFDSDDGSYNERDCRVCVKELNKSRISRGLEPLIKK